MYHRLVSNSYVAEDDVELLMFLPLLPSAVITDVPLKQSFAASETPSPHSNKPWGILHRTAQEGTFVCGCLHGKEEAGLGHSSTAERLPSKHSMPNTKRSC